MKMDKKQIQKIIEIRRELDHSYNVAINVIKVSKHETLEHSLAKFLVCYELLQNGQNFYTEVIFKNGCRADILDDTGTIYEIMHTETTKRLEQKNYPFKILALKAENIFKIYGIKL